MPDADGSAGGDATRASPDRRRRTNRRPRRPYSKHMLFDPLTRRLRIGDGALVSPPPLDRSPGRHDHRPPPGTDHEAGTTCPHRAPIQDAVPPPGRAYQAAPDRSAVRSREIRRLRRHSPPATTMSGRRSITSSASGRGPPEFGPSPALKFGVPAQCRQPESSAVPLVAQSGWRRQWRGPGLPAAYGADEGVELGCSLPVLEALMRCPRTRAVHRRRYNR
jgi:hypothetical protein